MTYNNGTSMINIRKGPNFFKNRLPKWNAIGVFQKATKIQSIVEKKRFVTVAFSKQLIVGLKEVLLIFFQINIYSLLGFLSNLL